ncbi:hypothetical protein QE152_g9734 [Popillia japonica]|uniref:Uncharacterized protein n=1 Tax=Popillia japonica TaxID=7064 RepID=A0AAW1LTT7_POPJA
MSTDLQRRFFANGEQIMATEISEYLDPLFADGPSRFNKTKRRAQYLFLVADGPSRSKDVYTAPHNGGSCYYNTRRLLVCVCVCTDQVGREKKRKSNQKKNQQKHSADYNTPPHHRL